MSRNHLFVLLLVLLLLLPLPARAQEVQPGAVAAANNDDEVVYIDPAGYIRVYDAQGSPKVTWVSPEGGWTAAALGDFTGEGDDEIVAVGGEGAASRLVVYDPVIASGPVDANQQFNGIPWRTLYLTALPATPQLVAVGEFHPAAGREIVYTTDAEPAGSDPRSQITVLAQTAGAANGSSWAQYATLVTGQEWSDISTGDLEVSGIDNIALIDEDRGVLSVFRLLDGALVRYFVNSSDTREWSSSAIGNVDPATAQPELVLVRRADRPLASLIVWRFEAPDKFVDVYLRDFNPAPRVVFLADINGNNESEIFMLRNVRRTAGCPSPYNSPPFQLIMRSRGEDRPPAFEICLDQANTFRYGVGGDLYGDGMDEVIVLSATQLRIFPNLNVTFNAANVINVSVDTNARTIGAGNLDKAGSVTPNTLRVSLDRLSLTASAGLQSNSQSIEITNSASSDRIPLRVRTAVQPTFLRWSLSSNMTPATLTVYADAAELLPDVTYAAGLIIDADGVSVSNTPLRIAVLVKVERGLVVRPANVTVVVSPCTAEAAPPTVDLRVLGSAGVTFRAEVGPGLITAAPAAAAEPAPAIDAAVTWPVSDVPWITSASSPTTTVPSTITLALDPAAFAFINEAHVSVDGTLNGESYPRVANLTIVCTATPSYLPFVPVDYWPE